MIRLFFVFLFCGLLLHPASMMARDANSEDYLDLPIARLAILDKITARVRTIDITVGSTTESQRLRIDLTRCAKAPPEFTPEALAFLSLAEVLGDDEQDRIPLFSGWMFASSPGLSAVEHPVYDVWLIDCLSE